jgi:hypothetical protein
MVLQAYRQTLTLTFVWVFEIDDLYFDLERLLA